MKLLNLNGTMVNVDAIEYFAAEESAKMAGKSYIKLRSGATLQVAFDVQTLISKIAALK